MLAAALVMPGCGGRAPGVQTDARHFFKATPEDLTLFAASVKREVTRATAELNGPLQQEIADYLAFYMSEVGPLAYVTREYAEAQILQAQKVPGEIVVFLNEHLVTQSRIMIEEANRYGRIPMEVDLPQLHEDYRRFMVQRKAETHQVVEALKRYDRVNMALAGNLSVDVESFFAWQVENSKAIPGATARYFDKVAQDFSALTDDTNKMFSYQLDEKPRELSRSAMKFVKYNTEEMLQELGRSSGRYLWTNLEISDLVKEIHCYAARNIATTGRLVNDFQDYFSIQSAHARQLNEEVARFLDWRVREWSDMKTELDRYLSVNVADWARFKEAPMKYIENQAEELERLKKTVPAYFLNNVERSEGLMLALRRYFDTNIGDAPMAH